MDAFPLARDRGLVVIAFSSVRRAALRASRASGEGRWLTAKTLMEYMPASHGGDLLGGTHRHEAPEHRLMKPAALFLALILTVVGCANIGQQDTALSTPLAPSEVDWARQSGPNTVGGRAVVTVGGTSHSCAGQPANLIPDSSYARERMTAIFGNTTSGRRAASLGAVKFQRDDSLYVSTLRTARCNASGSFSFAMVPDGVWYVTTSVKWQGASQVEGGSMMQRVDVRGGQLVEAFLSTGSDSASAASPTASVQHDSARSSIPMKKEGGTYLVPVLINNAITLDFVVDSGASDVSIPADVVLTLIRAGTIQRTDFIGAQTYVLADGSKIESHSFRIRSLKVGDRILENVIGSVASTKGSLLLGQSFLGRFKSWSIDNSRHALVLE